MSAAWSRLGPTRRQRHSRWRGALAIAAVAGFSTLPPAAAEAQEPLIRLDNGERSVVVAGVTFHVRIEGAGTPLLLLHGFTGAGRWWDPLVKDLAARHTVIIPDLPLHGRSTGRHAWRYADVAADVLGLMDELGIARFRAVGYSAGGEVLLHMAVRQPERHDAVVLVSAVHRLSEDSRETLRNWPAFDEMPQQVREFWLEAHPGGREQVAVLADALRGVADQDDAMNFTPEELTRMTAPTLIVVGDQDGFAPVEVAVELFRALPRAGLWVVPGQGHSPLLEKWGGSAEAQRVFADVVSRFFERGSL
jgi:pimeloyl-ACP methyl ester carboxylesterase